MKHISRLLLYAGLLLAFTAQAQLPATPNADYTKISGTVTDARDGKTYAYKQFGDFQWFVQNLAYEGTVMNGTSPIKGIYLPIDPEGKVYGMVYPSSNLNTNATMNKLCPEGWTAGGKGDYDNLFNSIISEYNLTDIGQTNFAGLAKYLRAGGVVGTHTGGLWVAGTEINPKAAEIGFNALPSGVFNIDANVYDSGDANGTKASFLTGGWYHYFMVAANNDVRHTNRNTRHHAAIRCFRANIAFPDIEITTPYPTTVELNQKQSAENERTRLRQAHKKSDHFVTGFFAPISGNNTIEVNVETVVASTDGSMPSIVIGTPGHIDNSVKEIQLKEGVNTIDASKHSGGLIYFRYVTNATGTPQGKVKITFTANSKHVRAPHFVYGTTSEKEFASMLGKYQTEDVIMTSGRVIVIATRSNAIKYSRIEDKNRWMEGLHKLVDQEEIISGMNNSDANALHHTQKPFEVRHMMIETTSTSPHASPNGYTAYPAASINRYLTYTGSFEQPWMMAHEVGHQHQQSAYMIDKATESTVNIYSYVVTRFVESLKGNTNWNRTTAERWGQAQNTYLKLPVEQRIYNIGDSELEAIVGFNRDELRFMVWEHLFIMFGDEFYKTLHRVVREENANAATNEERKLYLIQKSSQVTGYDLREFFNQWGIRINDDYLAEPMNKEFEKALAEGTIIAMPLPADELVLITGQNRPAWTPLALRGISTSTPPAVVPDAQPADELASKLKYTDYSTSKGVFEDARDNKKYHYKQYGNKEWFTENLNYEDTRLSERTNYPASIYPSNDPEGKVYGRMYSTYVSSAIYKGWCPEGWSPATESDWADIQKAIKDEYQLTDRQVASAMIAGGDRDDVADGLWAKGSMGYYATDQQRNAVGFNALPAGVFSYTENGYEAGDERGAKASFYEPVNEWYHFVLDAKGMNISKPNRNSRHYGSIRCVRPASDKIDQAITFEPIEAKNMGDVDFTTATASSNLPVTYTSSDENVATIINGKIHIVGPGTTTIKANQAGNDTYNPAIEATQTLTVLNNAATLQNLYINGYEHDITKVYDMPCDAGNNLHIEIEAAAGATVSIETEFDIVIDKPMTKKIEFTITSEDGTKSQKYTLNIAKPTDFFAVAEVLNDNVLHAKLCPTENGGRIFVSFKWYKNGQLASTLPGYNPSIGKINPADEFYLELITLGGEKIRTCVYKSALIPIQIKAYPNPARPGETIKIQIDATQDQLKNASIRVYSIYGFFMGQTKVTGNVTPIKMPYLPGTYIIKINNIDGYTEDIRVIVKL